MNEVPRGKVGQLSRESRMRLLRFLNQIAWEQISGSLFVTLTYPDEIQHTDYSRHATDRYLFLRYMEKHLGRENPVLWRLEWQPRKTGARVGELMPHYHLLVFGVSWLPQKVVREWWRSAIGAGDGPLVTDVRRVTGVDGACRYLAKYVSKSCPLDIAAYHNSGINFGRHWGVTRKHLVPMCPVDVCRQLTDFELSRMQGLAEEMWSAYRPESSGGFTLLGEPEAEFAKKIGGPS